MKKYRYTAKNGLGRTVKSGTVEANTPRGAKIKAGKETTALMLWLRDSSGKQIGFRYNGTWI